MKRVPEAWKRAIVLAALAAGIGRLVTSGGYAAYVRPGMRVPLLVSAAVLFVLALASAWSVDDGSDPGQEHDHDPDHDHDHGRFPRIGVWLLVPILCIAVVPIVPLGAGVVDQKRANVLPTAPTNGRPPPPIQGDGELTLLDFTTRVVTDPARPFTEPVTLTGFVASTSAAADEFVLGRFVISCCAADAQPILVTVRWDGPLPEPDDWVEVTGTQVPAPADLAPAERSDPANVVVDATEVTPVDQPAEPYLTT